MRIKDYFTVPEGQKVTEKAFRRVLITSVCSILLCMSCLVGTTWAWFTVSVENQGNEIQIVDLAVKVSVYQGVEIAEENGGYPLAVDTNYDISAEVYRDSGNALVPNGQIPYVVMTVRFSDNKSVSYFAPEKLKSRESNPVMVSEAAIVSFEVRWSDPSADGVLPWNDSITIIGLETANPSGNTVNLTGTRPSTTETGTATEPPTAQTEGVTEPSTTGQAGGTNEGTTGDVTQSAETTTAETTPPSAETTTPPAETTKPADETTGTTTAATTTGSQESTENTTEMTTEATTTEPADGTEHESNNEI